MKKRMRFLGISKRWFVVACALSVILGAGTTVAVAWGCVIRWERQPYEARDKVQSVFRSDHGSTEGSWDEPMTSFTEVLGCYKSYQSPPSQITEAPVTLALVRQGHIMASREEFSELLPAWSRLRVEEPVETMPGMDLERFPFFGEIAAGWPWLALRGEYVRNIELDAAGAVVWRFPMRSGIIEIPVENWYGREAIIVPFRPIWPGFIGSVILYGSAWLMVLTMPGVLRRRLRRKRGRCPMCNYDLRGDLDRGCSECGWNREA